MPVTVKTANVSLTPEMEALIDGRVSSGRFCSVSAVVRAAWRLLEDEGARWEAAGRDDGAGRAAADNMARGGI